ncbi:hypothetical protein [Acinetobacter defluvii]|uniref:hypothetical protein n=1 Tax=Acinetobacter defluvii TaxID=1871111 RepID=UPI003AF6AD21
MSINVLSFTATKTPPSWSSQFIIAAINNSGRYSPLRFEVTGGDEEIEIPYAITE